MTMSRRKFLLHSAVGITAGYTLSLPASGLHLYGDKPLRIGIIGTGDRGAGLASLFKSIPHFRLAACCDVLPFRLSNGMKYGDGKTKAYQQYEALLGDKNVDAVIIATPFNTHARIAMDAIDAGKHVYCEKTLCYGMEDTRRLVAKARASKKIFQAGHQYHSSRLYHHIVDMVRKGYIGKVSMIECQWNRNWNWRRPVPDPRWERQINWRMYREYSGGLAAELCSHQVDFANWITGQHPTKVVGFGGIDHWKDGRETYDNIHLAMEYPNGMKATYTCLTTNARGDYQIKVLGNEGTIVVDYGKAWVYPESNKIAALGTVDGVSSATLKSWENGEGTPIKVKHRDPSLQALLDFSEAIEKGKQPLSNVETGARVAVAVQMALDAMDHNRTEYWKDEYNF